MTMFRDVLSWLCVKQEIVNIDTYPTSTIFSLASLPEELYYHVVRRVFLHASTGDHLSLLLVCKTWNIVGRTAPLTLRPNIFLPMALRRTFPKLSILDLSAACEVQDDRLPCLVGLENLMALKLKRCREITDNGLSQLHPLIQLQSLNLARCYLMTDYGLRLLCQHLVRLKRLNIKHCYSLTTDGLSELTCLTGLSIFNCSGCTGLRYEALDVIGRIGTMRTLKMNHCTALICPGIDPLLRLTGLQALLVKTGDSAMRSGDALLQDIARHLKQLQRLDITLESSITSAGLGALMTMTQLEFLYVGGDRLIGDAIIETVANLEELKTFQLVDSGAQVTSLTPIARLPHLRSLAIKFRDDIHLDLVPQVPVMGIPFLTKLTSLVLWNIVSLEGNAIASLPMLQELHLRGCPALSSDNMSGFINLRCLRVLKFRKCDALDDGIVHSLKWLPQLEQLYISACQSFTGKYFGVLSQSMELSTVVLQFSAGVHDSALKQLNLITSLRRLEVVMCPQVTEDGIRVLLSGDLKNLEYLNISGCHALKLTTQTFQNKLPKFKKLVIGALNLAMLK